MRFNHNLSFAHKLSTDMGYLVPIAALEVLPGDTFIHDTALLARVAPLVNPVMHDVDISVHHFYVPNRIIWDEWDTWITGENETAQMPTVTVPALPISQNYELADHFGIGLTGAVEMQVSALPFRAYNLIWNEYYRDQELSPKRGEDTMTLARVCWDKDYFTTARPHPQQGDEITLGFSSGTAPVTGLYGGTGSPAGVQGRETDGTQNESFTGWWGGTTGNNGVYVREDPNNLGFPDVRVDLTAMEGGININDLRQALALQRFSEARMRYGERYVDYLRYLGVNPSDGRLDRPEYLGGGKQQINFSEVLATAEGTSSNVGDMYGHGIAGLRSRRYRKMFEEHGWVLTLLSCRPRAEYMNAVPRKFTRMDPMDYWHKELETLPWQEIMQQEVDATGDPNTVFGYTGRFDEYRHEFSYASGSFRDGPEKDWHMGRDFGGTAPTLNHSFVECTPTDRIYGDNQMPELLINCQHRIRARRLVRQNMSLNLL